MWTVVNVITPNFVAIGRSLDEMWPFFVRHLGFVVAYNVWTTHEDYLVVFIAMQSLVGIDAVVSIMQVWIFCWFGLKTTPFGTFFHGTHYITGIGMELVTELEYNCDRNSKAMAVKLYLYCHLVKLKSANSRSHRPLILWSWTLINAHDFHRGLDTVTLKQHV